MKSFRRQRMLQKRHAQAQRHIKKLSSQHFVLTYPKQVKKIATKSVLASISKSATTHEKHEKHNNTCNIQYDELGYPILPPPPPPLFLPLLTPPPPPPLQLFLPCKPRDDIPHIINDTYAFLFPEYSGVGYHNVC